LLLALCVTGTAQKLQDWELGFTAIRINSSIANQFLTADTPPGLELFNGLIARYKYKWIKPRITLSYYHHEGTIFKRPGIATTFQTNNANLVTRSLRFGVGFELPFSKKRNRLYFYNDLQFVQLYGRGPFIFHPTAISFEQQLEGFANNLGIGFHLRLGPKLFLDQELGIEYQYLDGLFSLLREGSRILTTTRFENEVLILALRTHLTFDISSIGKKNQALPVQHE